MLFALVAGASAGAAIAGVGQLVARAFPLPWLALFAYAVVLLVEVAGKVVPLVQRDRETPRAWIDAGWFGWSSRNGAALGLGFTTRLGFLVVYSIPVIALASGDVRVGAVVWASYGGGRALASVSLGLGPIRRRWQGSADATERLFASSEMARRRTTILAAVLTIAIVVALA